MIGEWFAIAPGEVGDHVSLTTTTPITYEDAFLQAQELARTTGRTHRVVRVHEVAVYAAGKGQIK